MNLLRNIAGVVVGYLIFAVGAVMLFQLGHIDPHADAGPATMIMVIIGGLVFAFVGGFVAKLIAPVGSFAANYALFFIISSFAAFSLTQSQGSHYTQLAAIFLFGPSSFVGGWLRRRMERVN